MDFMSFIPGGSGGAMGMLSTIGMGLVALWFAARHSPRAAGVLADVQTMAGKPFFLLAALFAELAKRPPFVWIGDLLMQRIRPEGVQRFFDKLFSNSENPRLRGDFEAIAREEWPEEEFPQMYCDWTDELRPSLVEHGRVIGGKAPALVFSQAALTTELITAALRVACAAGLAAFVTLFFLWSPAWIWGNNAVDQMSLKISAPEARIQADVWGQKAAMEAQAKLTAMSQDIAEVLKADIKSAMPNGLTTAILAALLVVIGTWRSLVLQTSEEWAAPLREQTKEATIKWKAYVAQRMRRWAARMAQLQVAVEFDKTPLIRLGVATGELLVRGSMIGIERSKEIWISILDLCQHLIVEGGTGQGKTRTVLLPIIRQLFELQLRGFALKLLIFDAKAVLCDVVVRLAKQLGLPDDWLRVIGVEPHEYQLDVLNGISPPVVSDIIGSVMRQRSNGGSSGDSFWPDMAQKLIGDFAMVVLAWDHTQDGLKFAAANRQRPYSLATIAQMNSDNAFLLRVLHAVVDAAKAEWGTLEPYLDITTRETIDYLQTTWQEMAPQTKSGIQANITNCLNGFVVNPAMRATYGSGGGKNMMTVKDFWKYNHTVRLSPLLYGSAARIVCILVKTLYEQEARRREAAGEMDETYGGLIIDEAGEIVSADSNSATTSDATFLNVARSAKVFCIFGVQSRSALEQAFGGGAGAKTTVDNMLTQLRSRIYLPVECDATREEASKLAGKELRHEIYNIHHHESFESRALEKGGDLLHREPPMLSKYATPLSIASWPAAMFKAGTKLIYRAWDRIYPPVYSYVPPRMSGTMGNAQNNVVAVMQAYQHADERAQDREHDHMSKGNKMENVLEPHDFNSFGRNHAYFYIQRAGLPRQDIGRLPA